VLFKLAFFKQITTYDAITEECFSLPGGQMTPLALACGRPCGHSL